MLHCVPLSTPDPCLTAATLQHPSPVRLNLLCLVPRTVPCCSHKFMLRGADCMRARASAAQVGIIHTSYRELSRRNSGILMAGISVVFNSLLCSIHCHKVTHQPAYPWPTVSQVPITPHMHDLAVVPSCLR